uniref:Secreted protein n=1 Tax=Schistosoma curassoni TaxID=6186 RepID=A0A183JD35_9TREM
MGALIIRQIGCKSYTFHFTANLVTTMWYCKTSRVKFRIFSASTKASVRNGETYHNLFDKMDSAKRKMNQTRC